MILKEIGHYILKAVGSRGIEHKSENLDLEETCVFEQQQQKQTTTTKPRPWKFLQDLIPTLAS